MAVKISQDQIKQLLLAKGDKIALGVGGGVAALLLVGGVVAAVSATSPSGTVKKLTDQASRVNAAVGGPGQEAAPLPGWVDKTGDVRPIDPALFAARGREFEPVFKPNLLRESPQVVSVLNSQLDVIRLPYKAYDISEGPDGEKLIGYLKDKKPDSKDFAAIARNNADTMQRLSGKKPQPRPGQPRPGQPGPGGPPPGGGGQPGSGGAPGGGSRGGGLGGPGMGGDGGSGLGGGSRTDQTVDYATADRVAKENLVLAESVAPLRAVMVHGLVPLKEQMALYQQALKVRPDYDSKGNPTFKGVDPVRFAGFDVQRRVTGLDGTTSDWTDYDYLDRYYTEIRARALRNVMETGYVSRFFRYEDQLVVPLPEVADNLAKYPDLRMPQVTAAVEKMKQDGIPPYTPSDWERRLGSSGKSGSDNPLDPRTTAGGGNGTFGQSGPGGMSGGSGGPPGGGSGGPPGGGGVGGRGGPGGGGMPGEGGRGGRGGPGGGPPGEGGLPGGGAAMPHMDVDYLVLRFLDIDVRPGETYQYRVRLKVKNPNYKLKTGVARTTDATFETLDGQWRELPEAITLPVETQLYAIDPQKYQDDFQAYYKDHNSEFALKRLAEIDALDAGRRAVVQVQQWQATVRIDGTQKREPIGTWVVVDLPVAPGEFIGRRSMVELPLWSAGLANYVLRELAGGVKVAGIKDPRNQPKGWPINFRPASPSVLVDFDGGRRVERVGDRTVSDDAAQELLIIRPDGKLVVRNSAEDMADKSREERNATWTDWLDRVKKRKTAMPAGPGGPPGSGGGFGGRG